MRRHMPLVVAIVVAVGLMTAGCDRVGQQDWLVRVGAGEPVSVPILAGQHIEVGEVVVWNDVDNIYVTYKMTADDWFLTETHLHVAASPQLFPMTRQGNPIPGQFTYKETHDYVTEYTYTVPIRDEWLVNYQVAIAAHCVVEKVVDGEVVEEQTGWADGEPFPGRNWATWFWYTITNGDDEEPEHNSETAWGYMIGPEYEHLYFWAVGVAKWGGVIRYTLGEEQTVDLWAGAGQNEPGTLVGSVTVSDDGANVYVRFDVDPDLYYFTETHTGADATMEGFGNFAPGQLGYTKDDHDNVVTYTQPMAYDSDWGQTFYVAAHAVVYGEGFSGELQ